MEFEISTDRARVDRDWLWETLVANAYWGKWRTRSMFEDQMDRAWRVVGAYDRAGRMRGFARAESDGVSQAYLADVYVDESARGNGLGRELVRTMIDEGPGRDFRWMLHTEDAHGLYAEFGFAPPGPDYMERPTRLPRQRE